MKRNKSVYAMLIASVLVGCGAAGEASGNGNGNGGETLDANHGVPGPKGTLRGRVWMPANGPATVGAEAAIGVAKALVYVVPNRPAPIPESVYCETCEMPVATAVQADATGAFELQAPAGHGWLVVQKGQFRLETPIDVTADTSVELPEAVTTLPSKRDYENGKTIPRIAIATGASDALESVLGKIGLGTMTSTGQLESPLVDMDIYSNGGETYGASKGTIRDLVTNAATLRQYHILLIPCAPDIDGRMYLRDPAVLRNLRDYVAAGGKLYVTDYSAEWMDSLFPAQVTFVNEIVDTTGNVDTPAEAWNPQTEMWNTALFGTGKGGTGHRAPDAKVLDSTASQWLASQKFRGVPINPNSFVADGNFNMIARTTAVPVGTNAQGQQVIDTPKVWVEGTRPGHGVGPLTVTFQPAGCGRALYSTYHTTAGAHIGLVTQERMLLYLLMEIGVCVDNPVIE